MPKECEKQLVLKCPPESLLKMINDAKAEILTKNKNRRVVSNTDAVVFLLKNVGK